MTDSILVWALTYFGYYESFMVKVSDLTFPPGYLGDIDPKHELFVLYMGENRYGNYVETLVITPKSEVLAHTKEAASTRQNRIKARAKLDKIEKNRRNRKHLLRVKKTSITAIQKERYAKMCQINIL